MFGNVGSTRQRVTHLENSVAELRSDVGGVIASIADQKSTLDKIADSMTDTSERASARAVAVKAELREETDRKAKERNGMAMVGFGLLSAIALIVAALTGPWKEKLETTASGQQADTASVAAVREVLAQQGAGIGRNQDAIEIIREKNRTQDDQLRQLQRDQAFEAGWLNAKQGYPGQ